VCLFVTMTLPKTADLGAASAVLRGVGRELVPLERVPAIVADNAYFLVRGSLCECDTWLGETRRETANTAGWAKRHEGRRRAMEKKGWSVAKIKRAMADVEGSREQHVGARKARTVGSRDAEIAQWSGIIRSMPMATGAGYVGLMLPQYSGAIDGEEFEARREACSPEVLEDFLLAIEEDVLYEIRPQGANHGKGTT
jgi:hypothetical protein